MQILNEASFTQPPSENEFELVDIDEIKAHIQELLDLIGPGLDMEARYNIGWELIAAARAMAIALTYKYRVYRAYDGSDGSTWYAVED